MHQLEKSDLQLLSQSLCGVARVFGARQWCLATSGNFSVRIDKNSLLITQSGKDKSELAPDDLMRCDLDGTPADATLRPSAETALHACLYRRDAAIGAVFHTHSVSSTLLSRAAGTSVEFSGYEMQKALAGFESHENRVTLTVFDNSQDLPELAKRVQARLAKASCPAPGFLIRGHGLYAWGKDIAEARRHTEGLEFLLSCLWQARLAGLQ
ncbi:MAG: methylthioribulose 1-phosphate dehydratase [Gammaproteobacteria bacterium]|nr:methylthioribulose 1-phosphate dehydratase [Gammaproteobacteria bacterium]MDH4315927.1 methylthioribulose 1-phosphate dehydratase [Gammaproteobacteria bacterium]MDH5215248.1 methylthioribulose 1-phosphate dehydratase [Gammaproteobacteria bacterium]MDH5501662.1 methylthioribulose 1-phosphate dehydratase [Gammaproteobacteria bacterium]